MNILQILPQLNVGGVETGTLDLAKYLSRQGHRCVVVSSGGDLAAELEKLGVAHYRLAVDNKIFLVMLAQAAKLAKIIKEEKIDLVHARSRVPAWVAFMACRSTGVLFLTTAHGHYSRHIFSFIMGWGKYTIVPSAVVGRHMMRDFGVPHENIRLIPRSVDLEKYAFRPFGRKEGAGFLVGVIGRVTPIKGQIYFLKAFHKVLRHYPQAHAWIVGGVSAGKDNYMEELEVWRRRLGLAGAVEFLGNRRDIPQILSKLDLLVMPSVAPESFGRVIVEAQAAGVAVVASKVGGVVEIIDDGKTGLLVYPRDHDGMAEAMLRIFGDSSLAQRLVENARKKVEAKFSLESMGLETLKVYRETLSIQRILVIKMRSLGDVILSTPSFAALRTRFPEAKISCLVSSEAKDVLQGCPYIDELIICDFQLKDKGLLGLWRLAVKLSSMRFDLVIDLQNNRKSHFLSYATFASRRYGYNNGKWSFFLNRTIKNTVSFRGPVAHQFHLLEMLGVSYHDQALGLWPSPADEAFADGLLKAQEKRREVWIGINIGSSPRWQTKRWPAARFAGLCDRLAEKDLGVVLTGSRHDVVFARAILESVKSKPVCVVAKTSVLQLAALIRRCRLLVSADSAPLHIAAAMRTPFVALFGPTDPRRHLPPAPGSAVLQKDCPPCYKARCPKKTHACMESITVGEVMEAIEKIMKN